MQLQVAEQPGSSDRRTADEGGPLSGCSDDDIAVAIGQLAALESAVLAQLLDLVGEYDRRQAWSTDGATSMPAWLTMALGVGWHTAHGWVDIAAALEDLPEIAATFAAGRLGVDQVRALCRFATPATDADLAHEAPGRTAADLHRIASRAATVTTENSQAAHARRGLRVWWDHARRSLEVHGRIPEDAGAIVADALDHIAADMPANPDTDRYEPWDKRRADALVALAHTHLTPDTDTDANRPLVVVHADADTLADDTTTTTDPPTITGGPAICTETARRLACDARTQTVTHDTHEQPVDAGRTTRTIPPRLARLLDHRDSGCRFPGCGRTAFTNYHQTGTPRGTPKDNNGATNPENLVTLCTQHHRTVHEGRWTIHGNPNGQLTFVRPDGHPLTTGPPHLDPHLQNWLHNHTPTTTRPP